jgi:hypothetical protein
MKATEAQRALIGRLLASGHGPGLFSGTLGVTYATDRRLWQGKMLMSPAMEDWITRYAAWATRNPPPPPPTITEGG